MNLSNTNCLSAKICAMYGKRLRQQDYNELLQKQSIEEIAAFLKAHPAYPTLNDVEPALIHRGHLEALIKKEYFHDFLKLYRYLGQQDKKFLDLTIMEYEIEELLWSLNLILDDNAQFSGFVDYKYEYVDKYSVLDFQKLSISETAADLVQATEGTEYHTVLSPLLSSDGNIKFSAAEHCLWAFYYKTCFMRIKKYYGNRKAAEVEKLIGINVDIINISLLERLHLAFGMSAQQVLPMILEQRYKLTDKMIQQLINTRNAEEFVAVLQSTPYRKIFSEGSGSLKSRVEHHLTQSARKIIHFSRHPVALILAYLAVKESEIKNIKTIIEACRYQVPSEKITHILNIF